MRTHLLRTFYPPPAAEPETGAAANDSEYAPPTGAAQGSLREVAAPDAADRADGKDTYQLGG